MPPASSCGKCCMYEHRHCKLAGVKKSSSYVCSDVNNRARLTFIFLLKLQKYRREKYYSQFTQKWKVTVQKVRWFALGHTPGKGGGQKSAHSISAVPTAWRQGNSSSHFPWNFWLDQQDQRIVLAQHGGCPGVQGSESYKEDHPEGQGDLGTLSGT